MNDMLTTRMKDLWHSVVRRRRLAATTVVLAALTALSVSVSLMMPAISIEKSNPVLEAEPSSAVIGEDLSVTVTATADSKYKKQIFYLSGVGDDVVFADEQQFDINGTAQVKLKDDANKTVTLHKVTPKEAPEKSEEQSVVHKNDYWFEVPGGSSVKFDVKFKVADSAAKNVSTSFALTMYGCAGGEFPTLQESGDEAADLNKRNEDIASQFNEVMSRTKQNIKDSEDPKNQPLKLEWTQKNEAQKSESDSNDAPTNDSNLSVEPSDENQQKNTSDNENAKVQEKKIVATVYSDASLSKPSDPALGVAITLSGNLPEGATAVAYPIEAQVEGKTVLAAYDITVHDANNKVFEPAKGEKIKVTISSSALQINASNTIEVYHGSSEKPESGDTANADNKKTEDFEQVGTAERQDAASVSFYVTHFSPYALVSSQRAPFGKNPQPIETADTKGVGVELNLFDYDAFDTAYAGSNLSDSRFKTGINTTTGNRWGAWRDLRFYPSGIGPNNGQYTINSYTDSTPAALQGIVKPTLNSQGYPTTTTGSDLSYLFDPNKNAPGKTTYAGVNHLFTKDSSGYYRYDSGSGKTSQHNYTGNYAYYNKDTKNFTVYDTTYTNNNSGNDASSDKIGFFPFNQWDTKYRNVQPNGQSDANHYNHHLGMTMKASFMMPEGRRVNGNDMVFNFSGDDDMWVYVDGVLVLDIGGVHQPVSGSINFTKGTSTVNAAVKNVSGQSTIGQTKSLKEIFEASGKTWDDSEYATHTIQCFYLERGGCYSDLSMSFNLPVYNPGQLHVTKTVDGPGSANYKEKGFKFKVFIETSQGSNQYEQYKGAVTKDDGTVVNGADSDGTYTLKDGEGFRIDTKNDKLRYYVEEIDPGSEFSTTINGKATGKTNDNGSSVIKSEVKPLAEPEMKYKNSVTGTTVSVQKKWLEKDGITPKTSDLPDGVTLTLRRAWDTSNSGGLVPSTKHKVTFRVTSDAVSNAFISSVDDVADGGSLTFYPYGGATYWALPRSVTIESDSGGSASINPIGTQQYGGWQNITGYKLSNIKGDVTVHIKYGTWVTVDHTRTDCAEANVTTYDKAVSGGTSPGPGTVTHHDEIVRDANITNPVTVTADTNWRAVWNGLPVTDDKGNPYTYYVDESTVPAGYEVTYENNGTTNGSGSHTGITSGEITVKNKVAYSLPSTGGIGTIDFIVLGICASASSLLLFYFLGHRRAAWMKRS